MTSLHRILEAILFAAGEPQSVEQICSGLPDVAEEDVETALAELRERYETEERGWRLDEVADGWQLVSHPDLYPYVERFLEGKRRARLSRASLEALAVIAYRQPITRGEIEEMRGVDCGGVLHTLLERDLVTVSGRSEAIGRPLLYVTTETFLEHFGLISISSLPRLEEIEDLWTSEDVRTQLQEEVDRRMARRGGGSGSGPGGNGDGGGADAEPGGSPAPGAHADPGEPEAAAPGAEACD